MKNLNNTIWNKRLPSIFGIFFLLFTLGTITWLSSNAILFGTRAAIGDTPKNVRVSNITDTSFSVSYLTDDKVLGTINFGKEGKQDQVALDDRDKATGKAAPTTVHQITIKNLTPLTQYSFVITSGDENFMNENIPYTVTTGPTLSDIPSVKKTLTGKVTLDDGKPPTEALVFISTPTSQVLSAIVSSNGTYTIDLSLLRDKTLASFLKLTPEAVLQMQIVDPTRTSIISLLTSQTDAVPLIILSENYDFVTSDQPLTPSPVASESATASFPTTEESTATTPQILTPKEEQAFKDQQPLFRGKAVPNETVTITINSEHTISATVQADTNGNWQYRPEEPLEPGTHTITIRTLDTAGLMRVITQSFVVYAEGSQFTEPSISPSASITPNPTTKPTATPKPTNTPTPTKITNTPTASPSATKTPTPTTKTALATTPSPTKPPIPITGNTTVIMTIIGVVTAVAIGTLLFIFTTV